MLSRLKEPSTMAGLGVIALALPQLISGISQIVDFDEGAQIGEIASQAVATLSTGDWLSALFVALFGGAAIWKREKS